VGILTEHMQRLVHEQKLGYVATVCADGTPNLSPKGTTTVWDDDHLIFADLRSPGTAANLRRNPAVEINVVDPMLRKGYRFKGTATVLTEGPQLEEMLAFFERQGVSEARRRIHSIVLVKVERALALISPGYDKGLTEEEMRQQWERYWASLKNAQREAAGEPGPVDD